MKQQIAGKRSPPLRLTESPLQPSPSTEDGRIYEARRTRTSVFTRQSIAAHDQRAALLPKQEHAQTTLQTDSRRRGRRRQSLSKSVPFARICRCSYDRLFGALSPKQTSLSMLASPFCGVNPAHRDQRHQTQETLVFRPPVSEDFPGRASSHDHPCFLTVQ